MCQKYVFLDVVIVFELSNFCENYDSMGGEYPNLFTLINDFFVVKMTFKMFSKCLTDSSLFIRTVGHF